MTGRRAKPETPSASSAIDELVAATHLTDMMSRVSPDLTQVMNPENASAVSAAAAACARCGSVEACLDWLAENEQGGGEAVPGFCPNGRFIESLAHKKD